MTGQLSVLNITKKVTENKNIILNNLGVRNGPGRNRKVTHHILHMSPQDFKKCGAKRMQNCSKEINEPQTPVSGTSEI